MKNTEKRIKEAFMSLLETNSIEKIDVVSLCNSINITRQAFYYHYTSIYDVIYSIYLDSSIETDASGDPIKIIVPLVNFLYEKETFNKEVAKSNASDALKEFCFSYFLLAIQYFLDDYKAKENDKRTIARCLSNALSSEILIIFNDENMNKNKMTDVLHKIFSKESIDGLITSFNKH